MKVKVKTGKSFGGCGRYITNPQKSNFLGGTAPNLSTFLQRTRQLTASRPDCKTPVLHFSLSQPEGERLSDSQWQEATSLFLKDLGLAEHDHFFARHTDTNYDHIHVIVSKIDPSGKIWNERNSAKRAMSACTKIEQKLGLTQTKTLAEFQQESGHRRNVVRDGSTNEFRRTGKVKSSVELAIQKRKANEQNRTTHSKPDRNHAGLAKGTPSNPSKIQRNGSKNNSPVGRIASRQNGKGEVIFKQNNQIIATLNKDRTAVQVFSINKDAIDFAIATAVKSGQVPLEIYGTPEFIQAATQRAAELKIPTQSSNLGIKNKEEDMYKQPTPINPILDRLQARLDATDLNLKAGNISKSELTWRTPRHLKEWLADEKKRDRNVNEFALLDLSKSDERIKQEYIDELAADLKKEESEQSERSAEQHRKMRA